MEYVMSTACPLAGLVYAKEYNSVHVPLKQKNILEDLKEG